MKRIAYIAIFLAAVSCGAPAQISESVDDQDAIDIGFGSADRNSLAMTVSEATISEAESNQYKDIYDFLRNRVPGVEVSNTIMAGDVPHIQIRGDRKIAGTAGSAGEPLFLLDGVEYPDISSIHPDEIHSVQVLKDAAASAYGSRGANGVIMIKTKFAYEKEQAEREARKAARQSRKK